MESNRGHGVPLPSGEKAKETELELRFLELNRGAPERQYLNSHVPPLLDGLRQVAQVRPADPLHYLGSYYLERSKNYDPHQHFFESSKQSGLEPISSKETSEPYTGKTTSS